MKKTYRVHNLMPSGNSLNHCIVDSDNNVFSDIMSENDANLFCYLLNNADQDNIDVKLQFIIHSS